MNIYIKTFGCSFNFADSQNMAGMLQTHGFEIVTNIEDSDLVIINSCTVKNSAENKLYRQIKKIQELNKKIIVAGCVPQAQEELSTKELKSVSIIGTKQILNIVEITKKTLEGLRVVYFGKNNSYNENADTIKENTDSRLKKNIIRTNKIVEIVPINEGCLGNCTYCKTIFARGKLKSYNPTEIIDKIKKAVQEGIKEIWLTSQDVACYGMDIKTNLNDLLEKVSNIEGNFKVRIGMGNPDWFIKDFDKTLEIMKSDKFYKFLHIPIQSGSNNVLKEMKRGHVVEDFNKLCQKFQKVFPMGILMTDIIVGFPTETENDFQDTLNLIKKQPLDLINISRFWLRPGTKAEEFKQLNSKIIKERGQTITKLYEEEIIPIRTKKWNNFKGKMLIHEKDKSGNLIGKNEYYKQCIIEKDDISEYIKHQKETKNNNTNQENKNDNTKNDPKHRIKIGDIITVKTKSIRKHDIRVIPILEK